MGRLEKIVVLTVLFLVAVILGISLNTDDGVADPRDEVLAGTEGAAAAPLDVDPADDLVPARPPLGPAQEPTGGPQGLLSAQVGSPEAETPPAPAEDPDPAGASILLLEQSAEAPGEVPAAAPVAEGPFLLTREGLSASRIEELMIYTWRAGDSFTSLSDRYYGSRLETGRLRAANEGRDEADLRAGDRIFVPVRAVDVGERLARSSQSAGQWLGGSVYVVRSGDMLGSIALEVYGSASKWRKIYDANRDQLGGPDELKIGMRLRIPAVD